MEGKNMKKLMSIILSLMLVSFVSAGVYAAGGEERSGTMDDKAYSESAKPMDETYTEEKAAPRDESLTEAERPMDKASIDTSNWIGKDVQTREGEKVGTVEDFIHDNEGNISLAIISHGGFLGMGDEKVAVPYSLLTFDEAEGHFVADLTEDKLAGAPRIEDEANLNDRAFAEEVYRHFGERPYWTEEGAVSEPGAEKAFEGDTGDTFESETMKDDMGSGAGNMEKSGESRDMGASE
jgi:sporulation protein YlmC with PRC-barrel domain